MSENVWNDVCQKEWIDEFVYLDNVVLGFKFFFSGDTIACNNKDVNMMIWAVSNSYSLYLPCFEPHYHHHCNLSYLPYYNLFCEHKTNTICIQR